MEGKVLGRIGMFTSLLFPAMWAIAAKLDKDWTFGHNSLSAMGVSSVPLTAILFNVACIVTGALIVLYFYELAKKDHGGGVAGAYIASLSGVFLSMVGVFNLNTGAFHYFFATVFGLLATTGVVFYTMRDINRRCGPQSILTFTMLLLGLFVTLNFRFEIWEPIVVILGLAWLFLFSVGTFKPTWFWRVVIDFIESEIEQHEN